MTDQSEPTVAIVYPSLGVLRAAHADLLRRRRAEGETPALWEEAARFIADGRASGAVLDNDAERETAQSLLDYWSTLLYQAGQPEADATLHEFDPELAPELPDEPAPYVGLDAFHDARFFFGRERLVEQMATKLAETRLLAVVGPSGSGKSSAVLAGLLPALGRGALPGSEQWRILPRMVPGSHPLANLARLITEEMGTQINAEKEGFDGLIGEMRGDTGTLTSLLTAVGRPVDPEESALINPNLRSSASSPPPAVLVVDQFEETFTLCTDEAERTAFVENLLGLAASPDTPHRVILTMRSDYESWVSRIPALQDAFEQGRVQVVPLSAEELRRAIVEPAELVGLRYQEGIVEALASEVLGEPAALPLLQFTLRALWDERRRNRITWDVYKRVGGGHRALARAADRLYNELIPEEQVTAQRILLRLVRPGAGLEVTSGRVAVAELLATGEDPGRVERVLERLLAARLLKQSEGDVAADRQVEVAHEALVRNWPTLVEWLESERENLRQRRRLTDAAERWQAAGRETDLLLQGSALEQALKFIDYNPLESEFVRSSGLYQKRMFRRRYVVLGIVAVLLIGVIGLWFNTVQLDQAFNAVSAMGTAEAESRWALEAKVTAEAVQLQALEAQATAEANLDVAVQSERTARANLLGTEALRQLNDFPQTSLLLLVEALNLVRRLDDQTAAVSFALQEALLNTAGTPLIGHTDAVEQVRFSADGQFIASNDNYEIRIWDSATHNTLALLSGHVGRITDIAISGSGDRIATASEDGTASIWSTNTGQLLMTLAGHSAAVTSLSISPDGRTLITASADQTVRVWDIQTGQEITNLSGHLDWITHVAFSPDGESAATGGWDNSAIIWSLRNGKEILTIDMQSPITGLSYGPDSNQIAVASLDGSANIWSISDRIQLSSIETGMLIRAISFTPDGGLIVSGGNTSMAAQIIRGDSVVTIGASHQEVKTVKVSPDQHWLVTLNENDNTAVLWDLTSESSDGFILRGHDAPINDIAFSPDAHWLATASDDMTLRLWDITQGVESVNLDKPDDLKAVLCQRAGRNLSQAEWTAYFSNTPYQKTCSDF